MDPKSKLRLNSGNAVPLMGLGTWQLTDDTADTIQKALAAGYQLIDTSGDYGTQPGIGLGLKQGRAPREGLFIVTKVEEDENAYRSLQKSLRELGLEYVDLALIHRPPAVGSGERLWEGLIKSRRDGLTKDIGVSNYAIGQIEALIGHSGEVPAVNQIEWTPFGHDQEMYEYCNRNGIVIQAYSPLTRGKRLDNPVLEKIGSKYSKSPAQVLIRWNIQLGTVPLPKANQIKHLKENIDVFDFEMKDADMEELAGLNEQYSSLGHSLQYLRELEPAKGGRI